MTRWFAFSWLAICACASSPEFDEIVEDHREELPELLDCGEVEIGLECRTELDPAEQCLLDAFAGCEGAELRVLRYTVEGDPLPSVYFVEPANECHVVELSDHSADAYKGDYGDVIEASCTTLTERTHDEAQGQCAGLLPADCTTVHEWF